MSSSITDKISLFASRLGSTIKSSVKIALGARPTGLKPRACDDSTPLYILGNGPSLRHNIEHDLNLLKANHTLAVNFAANSAEFTLLKPEYYVLADPHFFNSPDDPNVSRLIDSLGMITWPMTLIVPAGCRLPASLASNGNLKVERFNFIAAEGFPAFENFAFSHRMGMPRPRNVLIPSIMIGIWLGYKRIYILGADHSWSRTLSVDDNNRVVSIQPHFYTEDSKEKERVTATYQSIPLHSVLESFSIAFRSYHRIERFARKHGVEIINATPGSFIDAFRRSTLS